MSMNTRRSALTWARTVTVEQVAERIAELDEAIKYLKTPLDYDDVRFGHMLECERTTLREYLNSR